MKNLLLLLTFLFLGAFSMNAQCPHAKAAAATKAKKGDTEVAAASMSAETAGMKPCCAKAVKEGKKPCCKNAKATCTKEMMEKCTKGMKPCCAKAVKEGKEPCCESGKKICAANMAACSKKGDKKACCKKGKGAKCTKGEEKK